MVFASGNRHRAQSLSKSVPFLASYSKVCESRVLIRYSPDSKPVFVLRYSVAPEHHNAVSWS